MNNKVILNTGKLKILEDSRIPLKEKGFIFVDVVTKEEIENINRLINLKGETNIGIYDYRVKKLIGTLSFGNSTYNELFIPSKIIWSLNLSSPLNEKAALSIRSVIEKKGPMIKVRIIAVL